MRLGVVLGAALLSGCALVQTAEETTFLLALDVARVDQGTYQPHPDTYQVEPPALLRSRLPLPDATITAAGEQVRLLRIVRRPGRYRLCGVTGHATAFQLTAKFHVPLLLDVEGAAGAVTYLGRATVRLRPAGADDFAAGPRLPVLEQRAAGFSNGTWDVAIEDRSAEDLALFRQRYPELAQASITPAIATFDRDGARAWASAWAAFADAEYEHAMQQALGKPSALKPAEARPTPPGECRGIGLL